MGQRKARALLRDGWARSRIDTSSRQTCHIDASPPPDADSDAPAPDKRCTVRFENVVASVVICWP